MLQDKQSEMVSDRTKWPFILAASLLFVFLAYSPHSSAQLRNLSIHDYDVKWVNPFSMSIKMSLSVTSDTSEYCLKDITGIIRSDDKIVTHFKVSNLTIKEGQSVVFATISLYKIKGGNFYKLIQLALSDDKSGFVSDVNMTVAWKSGKIESKSLKNIEKKNIRVE